ncbi:MAG: hypothetical protein AAB871_00145 [Patescibacteria group bacterium]
MTPKISKKLIKMGAAAVLLTVFLPIGTLSAEIIRHKNGELVSQSGTIYLIQDNQRYGFRSAGEFLSWGYRFDMVLPATRADMALPMNGTMKARAGTLALDTADGKTIYLVFDDGARAISADSVFIFSLFDGRQFFPVDLSNYPKGPAAGFDLIYYQHPTGALINDNGTIYLITSEGRAAFPSEAVFRSHGFEFNMAQENNYEDAKLPLAPVLKYRDGTLVNDNGTIFLISEGKKYGFKTWQAFLAGGYNLSAAISASIADYPEGESFE